MESEIYLLIAATAIAVTGIYFFFVRKPSTQGKQPHPAYDTRDAQQ